MNIFALIPLLFLITTTPTSPPTPPNMNRTIVPGTPDTPIPPTPFDIDRTLTPGTPIPPTPFDEQTPNPGTPVPMIDRAAHCLTYHRLALSLCGFVAGFDRRHGDEERRNTKHKCNERRQALKRWP